MENSGLDGQPDTPALRGLAEEGDPRRQLGAMAFLDAAAEVAAEAAEQPVGRLPDHARLLQQVVIGEELVVVELGERDGDGAGALAGAGGAALVGLHAGDRKRTRLNSSH